MTSFRTLLLYIPLFHSSPRPLTLDSIQVIYTKNCYKFTYERWVAGRDMGDQSFSLCNNSGVPVPRTRPPVGHPLPPRSPPQNKLEENPRVVQNTDMKNAVNAVSLRPLVLGTPSSRTASTQRLARPRPFRVTTVECPFRGSRPSEKDLQHQTHTPVESRQTKVHKIRRYFHMKY